MVRIGCTGAIGAGKSTVSAMLAARGAHVIDADDLSRRAVGVGTPGLAAVVERFGASMLDGDGSLDRAALASVVFNDDAARHDLEAIIHPEVQQEIQRELAGLAGEEVVVLDAALLVETNGRVRYALDGVIVVDAPDDLCVERLVEHRGMSEQDARARLASQIDRAERLHAADFVILNIGNLDELGQMVDQAWAWISHLVAERGQAD